MNGNTTTGIISNTTGSLFIRFELNHSLDQDLTQALQTVHWTVWSPDSGPTELMLSIQGPRKAPVDKNQAGPEPNSENFAKAFYEADFYANEQAGEQVDYVDVGYDWAEIRANCTLFTQLVQKVSGTQEMISAGPFKMIKITGESRLDLKIS